MQLSRFEIHLSSLSTTPCISTRVTVTIFSSPEGTEFLNVLSMILDLTLLLVACSLIAPEVINNTESALDIVGVGNYFYSGTE